MRYELLEDIALDVLALGRRLDDEVAIVKDAIVGRRGDALQRRLLFFFFDTPTRDLAGDVAIDCRDRALERIAADIGDAHNVARERAHMGDAVPHLSGPDDADRIDRIRNGLCHGKRYLSCAPLAIGQFLSQLRFERRYDLEQIADKPIIGDLEDGRFLVFVDGDDDLGILHAGEMLDRARYADGDIKLGRDDLAGLPDLIIIGHEAGIDGGARGADGGAKPIRELFQNLEILARLHAASARDDDARGGELRPFRARDLRADEARKTRCGGRCDRLDRGS